MSTVRPGKLRSLICSLIDSTHIAIKRPKVQAHASEHYRGCGHPLGVSALSDQLAARAVTMGERLGSDDARCSTQIDPILVGTLGRLDGCRCHGRTVDMPVFVSVALA